MLPEIAQLAIRLLSKHGFEAFVKYLIEHDTNFYNACQLSNIDERIIESPPEHHYQSADAFILNYHPTALYQDFSLKNIDFHELEEIITKYLKERKYPIWLPSDGTTIYSVNNYDSRLLGISDEELLDYYKKRLNGVLSSDVRLGIGNINTFLQNTENKDNCINSKVSDFFRGFNDGLSICISENQVAASHFIGTNEFPGITAYTNSITQPVIKLISMSNVLDEFNELLNSDSNEQKLEEFLMTHYRFIFGDNYDCITTQLWIKFPELDIGHSNRRLDIFMRNSVTSDWELFELKRPSVKLTKTMRDVPMFTNEVYNAIAQVKNYKNLLSQDSVRRQFEKEGIEYFQPEIHLVIGRCPEITNSQWRRIISDESALRILTYDNLYRAAENRLRTFANAFYFSSCITS